MLPPKCSLPPSAGKNNQSPKQYFLRNLFSTSRKGEDTMWRNLLVQIFFVASKMCSTNLISEAVSKTFKLAFHQIQSLYDKSHFCSSFKQLLIIENSNSILVRLMQKLFGHLTFPHFPLNHLILIWLLYWIISLNAHLRDNKKYIDFSRNRAFGIINLNTFLYKEQHLTKDSWTTY